MILYLVSSNQFQAELCVLSQPMNPPSTKNDRGWVLICFSHSVVRTEVFKTTNFCDRKVPSITCRYSYIGQEDTSLGSGTSDTALLTPK